VDVPGTLFQLAVLLLLVMPGVVFAAVRSRLRGPTPDDRDTGVRVLRAMMVSAALDTIYAFALGPHFVSLANDDGRWRSTRRASPE
jgi:hypothetical protein